MKTIFTLLGLAVLTGQLHAQVVFNLSSSPGVGNGPESVAAADVNGDGKIGLISANVGGSSLTVLTNNGGGGFGLAGTYPVGNAPHSVAAADVNGDGKIDLISANAGGNSLTVLTNNGSGGFRLAGTYSVGTYSVGNNPCSVAAADVNGDGKIDLISANAGGNSLTVLTNDGGGGFALADTYSVGPYPFSVAAADVNGDGKIDLISANLSGNSLTVLTNATSFPSSSLPILTFQPLGQTNLFGGSAPFTVAATATGIEPARQFSYQWRMTETNLPGATNNSLILANLSFTQSGNYDVVVSNYVGSVTSSVAVLDVQFILVSLNGRPAIGSGTAVTSGQVTISGGYPGGFLFYTLNGSTPTTSSTLYTGPFTVTNTTVVNVMAMSADFSQSTLAPPVTVQIIPAYPLVISTSGSGAVGLNPASGPYPSNSVVTLTATAATNWVFSQWTGDVTASENPYNLTMNGPLNVQAVFTPTAYPLTANTAGGGSVTVNGQVIAPATYYPTNSTVSITATASNGWSFLNWQGDASGTNNPLDVTMNQTNNIRAIFGTVVGTNVIGGGGVVLNVTNPVAYGTLLTASAVPAAGNYLVTWSSAASGTNSPTTILVTNATPTVGAVFATLPGGKYSLAVVVIGRGSVGISNQQSYYNPGSIVRLTATTTNAGTGFDGWSGDASGTSQTIVLTVNSNMVVQANFGKPIAGVTLGNLIQTFDGTAKSVSVTTVPTNLTVNLTYDGSANTPTNAGSYTVMVTITDTNYIGGATNTLMVNKATGLLNLTNLVQTYNGTPKPVTVNTTPTNLTVTLTYNNSANAPANAGSYTVVATISDTNYQGSVTNILVINPATPTITTLPAASAIIYGQTLANSTLSGGAASTAGSFAFTTPGIAPNAGTTNVSVTFTPADTNDYTTATANVLVPVNHAVATVTISNLSQTYNGTARPVSVTTTPTNLSVTLTYNGLPVAPTNVGNYIVVATVNDLNYLGSIANILAVNKGVGLLSLTNLTQTFDGTAKSVNVTTVPTNLTVNLTYNGTGNAPTNAGSYAVVGIISDTNYQGSVTNTLVINPAIPTIITLPTAGAITYGQTLANSTLSGGAASTAGSFAFTTPTIAPNAGITNVSVTFTPTDTNDYTTTNAKVLVVVNQAVATVTLTNLTQTYNGTAKPVSVATSPIGLNVSLTYNGLPVTPTNAGSYIVVAMVNNTNYFGSATNTLVISQAQAIVTISNLTQSYDGTPKPVITGTIPTNLNVNITYNGSNGIPSAIGSYAVIAAVNDANYYGSATNTLVIIPVPPFVINQPTNQNLAVGSPATFNVSASGTAPLSYQWQKDSVPLSDNGFISGSTTSNLTLNAVSAIDAGSYSVVITNVAGSVTSSNASLVVNAEVYVAGTNVLSGSTVSVPINLKALGQEISLQFSLSFNPSILTYQGVDNLSVIVTTNSPLPGQIGLTFQNFAGYSPGDQTLVNVVFSAQPVTSNTVSQINFADVPVGRQVIDGSFNVLTNVIYNGGSVTVVPAEYAADVYPRPTGDSTVDLRDWAEMGRFVTALDVVSNADEMLRADCAPRNNPDGVLTVADWVQAGRYAAKLDPLTVVSSGGIIPQVKPLAGFHPLASSSRLVQLVGSTATNGQTVSVPVNLVASGSENALGFNVAFDPAQLTLQGIAKGSAAGSTVMNVNTNQAATGRLGVTLALNSGNVFASGTNQIAKLSFKVLNQASGNLGVAFAATNPVVEQVCDINAGVLNASYTSAIISVQSGSKPTLQIQLTNGMVKLSWPQAFSNYMLQSIGTFGTNTWNTNLGSAAVVGTNLMITQPATNRVQFYRLSQ